MESDPESLDNLQPPEEISLPQSYAFTVTFDSDNGKQGSSGEIANKFSRRHIRNLSLPISKVYENKLNNECVLNGRTRKAGNHSEGYFSSDPDDDSKPKPFEVKLKTSESKAIKSTNAAKEKQRVGVRLGVSGVADHECLRGKGKEREEAEGEEDAGSDVTSEAGTYTIDKDNSEVLVARQSIDKVFGVQNDITETKNNHVNSVHSKVNDWALEIVEQNNSSIESKISSSKTAGITMVNSKIPSPMTLRARAPPLSQPLRAAGDHLDHLRTPVTRKSFPVSTQEILETESYLRATERVVTAMAARVSLSLDSGGESDAENSLGVALERTDSSASESGNVTRYSRISSNKMGVALERTDSSASESGTVTRYSRLSSQRKVRTEETKKKPSTPIVTSKTKMGDLVKTVPARVMKRESSVPPVPSSFSRTDVGRYSMRTPRPLPQSPLMNNTKKEVVVKKKSIGSGNARSNSTLSSKEMEFQNWKRRKSYNPMQAAAEGKKKEAAKKPPPSPMTQSINSSLTTPKSPVNPVLRSASFHSTRQLTASSSEEEEEEVVLSNNSAEEEDWPVLQAPRTSLENIAQGSRHSLYSNNSNSSTPPLRNRSKLEGVDGLVISAISTLSYKLKGSSCSLLNKLRILYDEDSPKYHQLGVTVDQLQQESETGSPRVRSPSRELAYTHRNLKRLESMLKVLDEVLFDNEEFQ